jgi:AcrR family transcriptional regulator
MYDRYLRKAPRQSRSRAAVEAILAAAVEYLSRDDAGEEVALQRVADRAGVGVGSLYDYFRDRDSLWRAAAAKITEDNERAFELLLDRVSAMTLAQATEAIVDFALETYARDSTLPKIVLRIAYAHGLMPTLAASQARFARSLASALRKRSDVSLRDAEATAWVLTSSIMGVVHALLWTETPTVTREATRAALLEMCLDHLAGASSM